MDLIYKNIWGKAKPYYLAGRAMDIDHIEWMMEDALVVCEKEGIDESLLIPLVILHDIGYSQVSKELHFEITDVKKLHMEAGSKIAVEILNEVGYQEEKIEKIEYYVSVHDNWALGDDIVFKEDIILGIFNDLDFIWLATPKGFSGLMKIFSKTSLEMLEFVDKNEKLIKRPFSTKSTAELYNKYINERKEEVC